MNMEARSVIEIGARQIGMGHPVYVIAEVGSNHNTDRDLARRLVDAAARAEADAVKFQLFKAEWLYPRNCGVVDTPMGKVDFFEVLERAQLAAEWLPELKAHAEACGLDFLCTPFDEEGVAALKQIGVNGLKIASPELNHLPLLRAAARTGLPMICSTGLCTLTDIEEALHTIGAANAATHVALLQCVSGYPTPVDESNLAVISTLTRAFGVPVGLSDHTTHPYLAPATAVAVDACLIEKHYTLDRSLPGPDHPFAIEPDELREMVRVVRELQQIPPSDRLTAVADRFGEQTVGAVLGHGRKEIMPSEADLYPCDKRSIHAIRDIAVGEPLSSQNIRILRSERNLRPGLHPRFWETIHGAQVARPIAPGEGVRWDHLLLKVPGCGGTSAS